jgi:hypothetical protein
MVPGSYGKSEMGRRGVGAGRARWPARYEIRLDGVLEEHWSEWFGGLKVESGAGETILSGTLSDQPALHGLLERARDLGLSVMSVRRLPPERSEGDSS